MNSIHLCFDHSNLRESKAYSVTFIDIYSYPMNTNDALPSNTNYNLLQITPFTYSPLLREFQDSPYPACPLPRHSAVLQSPPHSSVS